MEGAEVRDFLRPKKKQFLGLPSVAPTTFPTSPTSLFGGTVCPRAAGVVLGGVDGRRRTLGASLKSTPDI